MNPFKSTEDARVSREELRSIMEDARILMEDSWMFVDNSVEIKKDENWAFKKHLKDHPAHVVKKN